MGIKRKITKCAVGGNHCEVPGCGRPMLLDWSACGITKRVCNYHFTCHCDENNSFDLFDAFGIKQMKIAVDIDEAGRPVPQHFEIISGFMETSFGREHKREWRPLPEMKSNRPRRRVEREESISEPKERGELDSIVNEILGDS